MIYDFENLIKFCEENGIQLADDYSGVKIHSRIKISGLCKTEGCEETFTKNFQSLTQTGGYCCECTKNAAKQKLKKTWLDKYGVEHISKLETTINKVKKTCLKKYGTECSLWNKEVNEKSQKTISDKYEKYGKENCLEEIQKKAQETTIQKYGVTHYAKTEEFKEKYENTCLEKYGKKSYAETDEYRKKCEETCQNKYGTDSYSKTDKFKSQRKTTCLEKFGVDHYTKTNEFKNQYKSTCLEKFGVDHYSKTDEFKNQYKSTCLEKFGVDHYTKTNEFKNQYKSTCLEKFGVENSSQNPEIMEKIIKTAYSKKTFTFPSGRTENAQGFEHFALRELLDVENITEDDIVVGCKNVPRIWYNDNNGKKHVHYVDIFIKSQNRCIEVKSSWTKKINLDNIFLKQNAGKELGYEYEIWVYNNKGVKIEMFK